MRPAYLPLALTICVIAGPAMSDPFESARIGDQDGFGFEALPDSEFDALDAFDGTRADVNGNGRLEQTEFLPDLTDDGKVAPEENFGVDEGDGDDFDNRNAEADTCIGCTTGGNAAGKAFTDISLSTSYDDSQADDSIFNANAEPNPDKPFPENREGEGSAFPAGDPDNLSNQPGFVFDFSVPKEDITEGTNLFFNMVFGDFGVTPGEIELSGPNIDGTKTIELTQQDTDIEDGLIQAATATLAFEDIFSMNGTDYEADLNVDFVAPNEPYTAFDFAELSASEISLTPVPSPATALFFVVGLGGLAALRIRSLV